MEDETVALLIGDDDDSIVSENTQVEERTYRDCADLSDHVCSGACLNNPQTYVNINTDVRDIDHIEPYRDQGQAAPELPEGKRAHMFISYSSEDRETVLPLVYRIERDCGMVCIFDERDFQPGMQIHDNIKHAMDTSMKVLLFLSENFTRSGYCNYEKDLAFIMSLENGGNNVIPVKLEECYIPSTLKTLTYVDATKEETDLPQKIVDAFNKTDASEMLPFWTGSTRTILENGFVLDIPCDVERNCPWYPKVERTVIDETTRLMIQNAQFKVSLAEFQRALDIVNKFRMRGRWPRYDCRVQLCLICCGIISIPVLQFFVLGALGGLSIQDTNQNLYDTWFTFTMISSITLPFVLPLIIYLYYKCRQLEDIKRLKREIFHEVTMETYRDGALFEISLLRTKCNHYVGLRAIRYDIHPCCKYLARHIKNLVVAKLGREVDNTEDFLILANEEIKTNLLQLMNADVPYASVTRHPVKGGKSCFCQMLEPRINDAYVEKVCNRFFRMEHQYL